jgi:fatty acid amide hydrolase
MDRPSGGGAALDLLLSPVMPTPAFRHRATLDLGVPGIYTSLYNLLGWPAGVVPCGRVRGGEEGSRVAGQDIAERSAAVTETGSAGLPLAGCKDAASPAGKNAGKAAAPATSALTEGAPEDPAAPAGLPLAVQVAARPWHEHVALAAMRTIESAQPGLR